MDSFVHFKMCCTFEDLMKHTSSPKTSACCLRDVKHTEGVTLLNISFRGSFVLVKCFHLDCVYSPNLSQKACISGYSLSEGAV